MDGFEDRNSGPDQVWIRILDAVRAAAESMSITPEDLLADGDADESTLGERAAV